MLSGRLELTLDPVAQILQPGDGRTQRAMAPRHGPLLVQSGP